MRATDAIRLGVVAFLAGTGGYIAGRHATQPVIPALSDHVRAAPPTIAPPSGIAVAPVAAPGASAAIASSGTSKAIDVARVEIDSSGKGAAACLVMTGALSAAADVAFADYVRIATRDGAVPTTAYSVSANGGRLCLGGLTYGPNYTVTLLKGLPGAGGARLLADTATPVTLGDLPPSLDFADDGFILSRNEAAGLPISTVNIGTVHVTIGRITDRILARTEMQDDTAAPLSVPRYYW